MLSYVGVIERLKVINIAFFFFPLSVFEMKWHEGLWVCVYKGVKVKTMDGNAKSFFMCKREEKF